MKVIIPAQACHPDCSRVASEHRETPRGICIAHRHLHHATPAKALWTYFVSTLRHPCLHMLSTKQSPHALANLPHYISSSSLSILNSSIEDDRNSPQALWQLSDSFRGTLRERSGSFPAALQTLSNRFSGSSPEALQKLSRSPPATLRQLSRSLQGQSKISPARTSPIPNKTLFETFPRLLKELSRNNPNTLLKHFQTPCDEKPQSATTNLYSNSKKVFDFEVKSEIKRIFPIK